MLHGMSIFLSRCATWKKSCEKRTPPKRFLSGVRFSSRYFSLPAASLAASRPAGAQIDQFAFFGEYQRFHGNQLQDYKTKGPAAHSAKFLAAGQLIADNLKQCDRPVFPGVI
ncbi:hypothetical protein SATMO3_17050 [Sporomusa aerivorans]